MDTNRTRKHYQLEERVTRAQTYIFVLFFEFVNVVIFFCFCHLKDFTLKKQFSHFLHFFLWIHTCITSFEEKFMKS